jgi:hypothetical protein
MPAVVKLSRTDDVVARTHHVRIIVEEVRHALTQIELQKQYPNREPFREADLPDAGSEWPSAFDVDA